MKIKNTINLKPNELCILIKIVSQDPETGNIQFEVRPHISDYMHDVSESAIDTITDIMKGMCAVTMLESEALDVLLELYYDGFKDMENVLPFPVKPVTKH